MYAAFYFISIYESATVFGRFFTFMNSPMLYEVDLKRYQYI